jgi:hypothetical protein
MMMATAAAALSTKELAHKAREDKANSLRGLFDKCFIPIDTPIENATYSENTTPGNATCSENKSLENAIYSENATRSENTTCSENATYNGRVIQLSRSLNFAALGVLAVLLDEFTNGTGILNISQLAKACDVARSTIIAQLRILEDKGMIALGAPEKGGRVIKITCSENTTCSENATVTRGSSSFLVTKDLTTTTTTEDSENATCSENATHDDFENTGEPIYTALQPWEKMKLRDNAEDLFYIAIITKSDVGQLSMQTLRLFERIYDDKGRDHALALFLLLLPKAKDNPTGYIWSSFKQGAEPNAGSLKRVKEMQEVLGCLAKTQSPEEAKEQMQTALNKNDTQALLSLAKKQEEYKKALNLLSWGDTFEALVQKREEFISSVLK